jgi:imidazolonepropionase-like amidohydrolase
VAVGTDGAHGLFYFELECLVRVGFSPMEALLAGTRDGAEAIGLGAHVGTLERGKSADVVAVRGDPLADIRSTKDVVFVMKQGKTYRSPQGSARGEDPIPN